MKSGCPIVLGGLLIFGLMLVVNAQQTETYLTIYIRPDGSVEPSDAPISTEDNITYTFRSDI